MNNYNKTEAELMVLQKLGTRLEAEACANVENINRGQTGEH